MLLAEWYENDGEGKVHELRNELNEDVPTNDSAHVADHSVRTRLP